ncbi:proline--tRNA ligase [Paenibacillus baekrokdamisoli]|uniref:Proline--tRNA ligase n=1 Tax=Paenibacillus baekrokdamisoli TaxID=1712516 RepID=A0A3G9IPV1_9BACL|nr:proline--tRNA ligase [Paenibacillus baekrokdamisoli]MBB3071999.1 prolyl-tRNA synthetase [Paenibacillus baekrokdamisoli]BBH20302.1 proline--tRNA ligase [Paenibacillus baekrokdamisoli]
MKQTNAFVPTLREVPADAEAISHQWLVKGGFIRQLSSGIYSLLPLGRIVIRHIETIVRDEIELAGAQEVLLPALQPAELWHQSGRYEIYGQELIRLHDRHGREFALGPTHEEVITSLIEQEIKSYRKLPLTLFQIQTKFRDERRPRSGLLRCREFLMKDAYSFSADWKDLDRIYDAMYAAYHRIFQRCGLNFRAVEADGGAIGGEGGTHEFMAIAESGEDIIVTCNTCDYAANLEKAASVNTSVESGHTPSHSQAVGQMERFYTQDLRTINELTDSLGIEASDLIKTVIFIADGKPVAVLVRGDHSINETKVKNALQAIHIELADTETVRSITGAATGFAGPVSLNIPLLVDFAVTAMGEGITGANETDYHIRHVVPGRDFTITLAGDYRNVLEGEHCPCCSMGTLKTVRGIELGHVFKLGTKYSEKLGATFVDSSGIEQHMIMGCYGIGITRLMATIIEQHHDEHGMIWPVAIAPYQVHLIPVSMQDQAQSEAAEQLYKQLQEAGIRVLLDDRDERMGVKLKDADLIGLPIRIVVGKAISEGLLELKERRSKEPAERIAVTEIAAHIQVLLGK